MLGCTILSGTWPLTEDGEYEASSSAVPLILIAHRISGDIKKCGLTLGCMDKTKSTRRSSETCGRLTVQEDIDLLEATLARLPARSRRFWAEQWASIGYLPTATPQHPQPQDSGTTEVRLLDLMHSATNPFQQETAALRLAAALTEPWTNHDTQNDGPLTPAGSALSTNPGKQLWTQPHRCCPSDFQVTILPSEDIADRRYQIPRWCAEGEKWKRDRPSPSGRHPWTAGLFQALSGRCSH